MYDYSDYKPSPPTAKALAIRDRLADEMSAAPQESKARQVAEATMDDVRAAMKIRYDRK